MVLDQFMATSARITYKLETLLLKIKWVILFHITFVFFKDYNFNNTYIPSFRFSSRLHERQVSHSYSLSLTAYLDLAFRKFPLGMLCQSGIVLYCM